MSDLAHLQSAFAQAARNAKAPVPAGLRGAARSVERRFAVYRNNVTVGLVSALRVRFPVVEQLVGTEFFRAMAGDYVAQEPPHSPVPLTYGDTFPAFIDRFAPAQPVPYLGDVARIERAHGLAYHAADAAPLDAGAFAALPPDQIGDLRVRLHPSVSIVSSRHPVFSIWRVNQNPDRVVPISPWGPEAALIARPFLRVETRQVPAGAARFIQELAGGAALAEAFVAGTAVAPVFDARDAIALLIATDIVIGFDSNIAPLHRGYCEGQ